MKPFSIVIPTWNNLQFLKCCVESIRKNSATPHQIIIHINDGSDGTLEWVKAQQLDFTHSPQNIGICWAMNTARTRVKTDYILYLNDDMYVCPGYDTELWNAIERNGTTDFFFSATMIEPTDHKNPCAIAPYDYGTHPDNFDEQKLLAEYQKIEKKDWAGALFPPNIMHVQLWDRVGGYSVEFSPGMYSDPDLMMKVWQAGVRQICGIGAARVYHFGSKSTLRVKKNNGRKQFLLKWGMTSGTFCTHFLRLGQPLPMPLTNPTPSATLQLALLKAKIKARFS